MNIGNLSIGLPIQKNSVLVEPKTDIEQNNINVADSVKLILNNQVKNLISEAVNFLQQRDTLLTSLPSEIQLTVQNVIQENTPTLEDLSQGSSVLAKLQKNTIDQLQRLMSSILISMDMCETNLQLPDTLQQVFRNYTPRNELLHTKLLTPDDLLLMAKQLLASPSHDISNSIVMKIRQFWQQSPIATAHSLPEGLQNAMEALVQDVPVPELIQTAATQYHLKELNDLWFLLQAKTRAIQLPDTLKGTLDAYNPMNVENTSEPLTADGICLMAEQLLNNPSNDTEFALLNRTRELWSQSPLATADNVFDNNDQRVKQFVDVLMRHVPESVKKAAAQYKLSELPDLWILLHAKEVLNWSDKDSDQLTMSIHLLRKLVVLLQKPESVLGEITKDSTIFTMNIPMYLGEGSQPYPVYIHIFHQSPKKGEAVRNDYETWIHICLQTENAGVVDVVFRLYQRDQLDVRVAFSTSQAAQVFADYLPEIRNDFSDFALHLGQFSVNVEADRT